MAKMIDLLESWLDSSECPIKDTYHNLKTGERNCDIPASEQITDSVINSFRDWCDGCASGVVPDGIAEKMIDAYKSYLKEMEKSGHETSLGDNEWFSCVTSKKVSDVEIRTTWEDIRSEEKSKKKTKSFSR